MGVRFTPNRNAQQELARSADVGRFLKNVADAAATEVDRRAPRWIKRAGGEFSGTSSASASGYEGRVVIKSSFYHLEEWGSRNNAPHPFVRPGVQSVLSRVGGRWRSS